MSVMNKAETYRKRSEQLDKRIKNSGKFMKLRLVEKKAALDAMAANEDWLSGRPGSAIGLGLDKAYQMRGRASSKRMLATERDGQQQRAGT
jgi:hypothetical protein